MICQKCKTAAASVCVSQVVDSNKTDIYLCQGCANEVAAAQLKAALGFLSAAPGHLVFGAGPEQLIKRSNEQKCESCGVTFGEVQKSGRLGCSDCYETFRTSLRPIITRIHRSAQHRGKSPTQTENDMNINKSAVAQNGGITNETPLYFAKRKKNKDGQTVFMEKRIDSLKASLTEAIREEEYEKAAELRDRIKEIENAVKANKNNNIKSDI